MNNNQISYKGITVERLLDYLSDKTLSMGCLVKIGLNTEIIDYPNMNSCHREHEVRNIVGIWNAAQEIDISEIGKIIGHPVTKGHIEKKIKELQASANGGRGDNPIRDLNDVNEYWLPFNPTTPLNEILSGEASCMCLNDPCPKTHVTHGGVRVHVFVDENTQSLFEFLVDTFYDQLK